MRVNTNAWNRIRYTVWSPIYDLAVRPLERMRKKSLELAALRAGERVLFVGAGTGADLRYVGAGVRPVLTDLTPAMLRRARDRAAPAPALVVMDGHVLAFPDATFDVVVLHLIVAVIPDPARCLREAARVLKSQGRIVVMDKFAPQRPTPLWLQLANVPMSIIGTELTRRFDEIHRAAAADLQIDVDAPAALPLFRHILLRKTSPRTN